MDAGPRAAVLNTILAGANRHRIEPWTYIRELLLRLHGNDERFEDLLPDRWAVRHLESVLIYCLEESRHKAAINATGGLAVAQGRNALESRPATPPNHADAERLLALPFFGSGVRDDATASSSKAPRPQKRRWCSSLRREAMAIRGSNPERFCC
jgi:hypothetical protein